MAVSQPELRRVLLLGMSIVYVRWTPHKAIATIRDRKDRVRVLLCTYSTTITGWGGSSCSLWFLVKLQTFQV